MVDLEERISSWPQSWGDDLHILLYGNFLPPDEPIEFKQLKITIHPERRKGTLVDSAYSVIDAHIQTSGRTQADILDASRRINLLLGAHTLVSWGNAGCSWVNILLHHPISSGSAIARFNVKEIQSALASIDKLPPKARKKVEAALFWIREPREPHLQFYRSDTLRIYAGYWNAFECLLDAVTELRPQSKMTKSEKQAAIDILVNRHEKLTCEDIVKCYQEIINPGIIAKATHVFNVCFPDYRDRYITECFKTKPKRDRLYDIRNAINHGDIDAENIEELLHVDAKLRRLWMIIWRIFGKIIAFPSPMERDEVQSHCQ